MDNLIAWIKNNQAKAAALGIVIAALGYMQFSKPKTFEDCLLRVVKEATNEKSAIIGKQACRKKFPVKLFGVPAESSEISFDDLIPKKY